MKQKTTQKYIKAIEDNIINVSYCRMQHLLTFHEPNYYTCGVYGWNADIYMFNDCTIVTGYRPFGNIKPDYDFIKQYDDKAQNILFDRSLDYETQKEKVNALLDEFLNIVLGSIICLF